MFRRTSASALSFHTIDAQRIRFLDYGRVAAKQAPVVAFFQQHGAGAEHAVTPDLDTIAQRAVHAEEAVLTNDAVAGDDDMGRYKTVVADHGAMSDMVSGP